MLPGAELVAGAAARLAVVVALDRERGEGRGLGGVSPLVVVGVAGFGRGLARFAPVGGVGRVEQALWQGQRLLLVSGMGLALGCLRPETETPGWPLGLGCVVCEREEPWVQVERQADGSYQATLCGHFTLAVADDHPFRKRLLIVFLNLLDASTATRGSRRTRDGRTPLVRQQQMAEWFDAPQPHISLWLRRWLAGDWAGLLSQQVPRC